MFFREGFRGSPPPEKKKILEFELCICIEQSLLWLVLFRSFFVGFSRALLLVCIFFFFFCSFFCVCLLFFVCSFHCRFGLTEEVFSTF